METLKKALSSRTIWTLVALFFIGGLNQIVPFMPEDTAALVTALLTVLAGYFKINPSKTY